MSSLVGNLYVRIGADTSELTRGLSRVGDEMGRVGKDMSAQGRTLTRNVTAPLLAVGAAAVAMGEQVQDGLRTIRRGTGATGDDLQELEGVFRSLAGTVPASFDQIGTAVADLNTRTGATGQELEELARSMLQLAQVTGEDVGGLISSTTRLFGDWGVATEDQAASLDSLFRVSQATGIGISKLADTSTNFGVQLRALGLTMEEATALLGTWEKEGVATEKILSGLSLGVRKLSESAEEMGTTIGEEFINLRDEIQAADEAQSIQIATMAFGARAGADMALAIREGRLEFEDFAAAMQDGTDSIGAASNETLSFMDSMKMMGQEVAIAAEPLGGVLVDAMQDLRPALESVIDLVARGIQWFADLPQPVQTVALGVAGLAAALGPLLLGLGSVISTIGALLPVVAKIGAALAGLNPVVLGVAAAVVGTVVIWKAWGDDITAFVVGVWDRISQFGKDVGDTVRAVVDRWTAEWNRLRSFVSGFTRGVVDLVSGMVSRIIETITGGLGRAAEVVRESLGRVTDLFRGMARTIVGNSIVPDMADAVVVNFVRMDRELMAITNHTVTGVSDQWKQGSEVVGEEVDGLATRVLRTMDELGVDLPSSIESTLSTARNLWRNWGDDLVDIVRAVWQRVKVLFEQVGQAAGPPQFQQPTFGAEQGGLGGFQGMPEQQRGGVSGFVEAIGTGVGNMLAGIFGGGGDMKGLADQIVVTTVWLGEALISRLDPMLVKMNEVAFWAVHISTDVKDVGVRVAEVRDAVLGIAGSIGESDDAAERSVDMLGAVVDAIERAEGGVVEAIAAAAKLVAGMGEVFDVESRQVADRFAGAGAVPRAIRSRGTLFSGGDQINTVDVLRQSLDVQRRIEANTRDGLGAGPGRVGGGITMHLNFPNVAGQDEAVGVGNRIRHELDEWLESERRQGERDSGSARIT